MKNSYRPHPDLACRKRIAVDPPRSCTASTPSVPDHRSRALVGFNPRCALQDLIYQGGVDQSLIRWVDDDGVGRKARNGLNFTERGFGVRPPLGCSDRGHTAVSQLKPDEIDWDDIFGRQGARWFHTGGIFCGLSETTPEVTLRAVECARKLGTIVSYDLNYRESLWKSAGGKQRAQDVNCRLAPYVDVLLGNEEDLSAALGTTSKAWTNIFRR